MATVLHVAWMTLQTCVAIAIAAFLWLFVLEKLGFGEWECWPS
jgi:hypothetical protein